MPEKKEIKEFIAAIELSSSKITAIAGKKNPDGSIKVLAYARENAHDLVKRGVVYNIEKTSQCLARVKERLETQLKATVGKAYIGISGQSMYTVPNKISLPLDNGTQINVDHITELSNLNKEIRYSDKELLMVIPQEYKIGNNLTNEPIGIVTDSIEGNFINIIAKPTVLSNLKKAIQNADIKAAEWKIAPLTLAQSVLTDSERRSGVVLVDLGAETTTVSVYKNALLRHLAVIPLGARNIIKDICGQQYEEEDAKEMLERYGCAYTEYDEDSMNENTTYNVTDEKKISAYLFNDIVESRMEEIILNVENQIKESGYKISDLLSGVVITGGLCSMKNMELAFKKRVMNLDKVRIAGYVLTHILSNNPDVNSQDGSLNTTLSLLISGKENCIGSSKDNDGTLFDTDGRPVDVISMEQKMAEEQRRREEEIAEQARQELLRKQQEEEEKKKKENSITNKFMKFVGKLLNEE